jgi:hypothetical protein
LIIALLLYLGRQHERVRLDLKAQAPDYPSN